MQVFELLELPKTKYSKGFKIGKKGRVVWTDVFVSPGDKKRIRLSRISMTGSVPEAFVRYVKPSTEIEIQ